MAGWGREDETAAAALQPRDRGRWKLPDVSGSALFSAVFRSPPTQLVTRRNLNFCTDFHTRVHKSCNTKALTFSSLPCLCPAMQKQLNLPVLMPSRGGSKDQTLSTIHLTLKINPRCLQVQGISLWEGEGAMGRVEVLGEHGQTVQTEAWPHVGLSSLPTSDLGTLTGGPGPDPGRVGDGLQREPSSFLGRWLH